MAGKRYRILPYKQGSKSAKALADALGGKVLKLEGSKFKPKDGDVIINWGCTIANASTALNGDLGPLKEATNKLLFFKNMAEKAPGLTPKFWTKKEDIPHEEYPIVCRTILSGHSGAGIVISDLPADAPTCQLYVKYEKKKDEYRVHCGKIPLGDHFGYVIISVQRKAKRLGAEDVNWKVRSHDNGFVFIRNNISPPPRVLEVALESFKASSLDFGAIDVIWNDKKEQAYVLEINTAPGLEGQTITDYATFFRPVQSV